MGKAPRRNAVGDYDRQPKGKYIVASASSSDRRRISSRSDAVKRIIPARSRRKSRREVLTLQEQDRTSS